MPVLKWGDAGKVWGPANTWGTFAAGDLKGQGTLTAAITTAVQLGSSVAGQTTAAAALSTAIRLAGSVTAFPEPTWGGVGRTWGSGVWGPQPPAKVSAALTVSVKINGALAGTGALAADLSTGIVLGSSVAGQGTVGAALSTSIQTSGAIAGQGTAAAALTTAIRLAGAVAGQGTLTGALSTAIQMSASNAGTSALAAALSNSIRFSGAIAAAVWGGGSLWGVPVWGGPSTTVAGALTVQALLASGIAGGAAIAGDLSTSVQVAGSIAGRSALGADLSTSVRLSGAVVAAVWGGGALWGGTTWGAGSQLAADLTTPAHLEGTLSGAGLVAADLSSGIQLSGALTSQAANAAGLSTSVYLVGAVAGGTSISGTFPAVSAPGSTLSEGDLMAVDLGTDIGCYPDLDSSFATVTSFKLLGQDLARRFETPRGGLFYDLNYGTDMREMVNDTATLANVQKRQNQFEAEAKKDERVQRATASVGYSPSSSSATVKLMVETALGPFTFVLNVTGLTVSLLKI